MKQHEGFPPELIMKRTIVLYGGSGSGKSTTVRNVIYPLRGKYNQAIVFCPTDKDNGEYSAIFPKVFVWHEMDTKHIERFIEIYKRQQGISQIYKEVSDLTKLREVANFIQPSMIPEKLLDKIRKVAEIRKKFVDSTLELGKLDNIEMEVLKNVIASCRASLLNMPSLRPYYNFIKNVDINPNILIIFDDCTEFLKEYFASKKKNDPVVKMFSEMFTKGRHIHITLLVVSHFDTTLDKDKRQNAHVSIFCRSASMLTYFAGGNNQLPSNIVREAKEFGNQWDPRDMAQKVLYKCSGELYSIKTKIMKPFRFFSPEYDAWAERLYSDKPESSTNEYYIKYKK